MTKHKLPGGHVKNFEAEQQRIGTIKDIRTQSLQGPLLKGDSKVDSYVHLTRTGNSRGGSYPLKGSYPKNPQKLRG